MFYDISSKLYQANAQQNPNTDQTATESNTNDEEVVDADFKVMDDEKKE